MSDTTSRILELTRAVFRQEAEDLLAELDSGLLQLEAAPDDGPLLHRVFRAMHTLKGSGATAGFHDLSSTVHAVEDVFNGAREGRVRITAPVIDLALKIGDVVRRMLFVPPGESDALREEGAALTAALKALVATPARPATMAAPRSELSPARRPTLWAVHFAPEPACFVTGYDPMLALRELLALGHGVVRARTDRLRDADPFDPTRCYLAWDVQLAGAATRDEVLDVFQFCDEAAVVRVAEVPPDAAWCLTPDAYFDPATAREFREEAIEDIAEIEAHVLALEDQSDAARLAGLKRALHNLKGVCGLMLSDVRRAPPPRHPLRAMSRLCHTAETAVSSLAVSGVDAARRGEIAEALIDAVDWLKELLAAFDAARDPWPDALLDALAALGGDLDEAATAVTSVRVASRPMVAAVTAQCEQVVRAIDGRAAQGAIPSPDDWQAIERALDTLARAAVVERAESFAARVRQLVTACAGPHDDAAWAAFRARFADAMTAVDEETAASQPPKGRTISLRPSRANRDASRPPQAAAAAPRSVRVDQAKLDVLMGAIGELLVAKNALPVLVARATAADRHAAKEMKETVARIAHIADDLQDAMRHIRMNPIRSVFQRFPRMIRDLARTQGKQVQLIISGDETELDKTVLEQIADPLVHLVRNAVDHGIEGPEERARAGKPELGTIGLEVSKDGSHVLIRIGDDGRGMDPQRLRAKAVERGVLTESDAAAMSDARALELIFLPGFSTAERVTDISGRGVGMDVVQSNIRQLHGAVSIASDLGRGSSITIRLPSSLLVTKGMLVGCATEQYVLPIEGVREMVKVRRDQLRRYRDVTLTAVRGAVCPVYSLAALLGLSPDGDALSARDEASAAIVSTRSGDVAVVVDRLVAEIDVVVKPLSAGLDKLLAFQGATILGDGSVALVLDVSRLDALVGLDARAA